MVYKDSSEKIKKICLEKLIIFLNDLLKSFFVKEAAGEYGNLPGLLKQ